MSNRRPFLFLSLIGVIFGTLALSASWLAYPPEVTAAFVLLTSVAVFSENYAVLMPGYSFSIVYPLTMAAVVLCGPTAAILLVVPASTSVVELREHDWPLVAYNFGQLTASTFVTGWTYVLLGGRVLTETGTAFRLDEFPSMFIPLVAAAVVSVVANLLLAAIGVSAEHGRPLWSVLEPLAVFFWGQVALGFAGFVIAQVMALEVWAFALFTFPLLIARQFYQNFNAMQEAYTDTIRSLVGALEAKDPYTRGHSERVAQYSLLLGRAIGLDRRALGELETAAILHDLGKLALSGALLRKVEKLDDKDWDVIRTHPTLGAAMVRKIPAVAALADPVERHHERLDGSGYPGGLRAEAISREARILAIADSFDAMTSDRPYRPGLSVDAAVSELRRCSEGELDRLLVKRFVEALNAETNVAKRAISEEHELVLGGDR